MAVITSIAVALFERHEYHLGSWQWKANVGIAIIAAMGFAGFLGPDARSHSVVDGPSGSHEAKHLSSDPDEAKDSSHPTLENTAGEMKPRGGAKATNFDLALEENGGVVESITGDDVFGLPLIDGNADSVSWFHPPINGPVDIVISFYNRQPALLSGISVAVPDPAGPEAQKVGQNFVSVPKDIEVWVTNKGIDSEYQRVGSGAITAAPGTQTIPLPGIEARFLKLRVLSIQRERPFDGMAIGISEVQVFEATAK